LGNDDAIIMLAINASNQMISGKWVLSMPDVLVRDIEAKVVEALKNRAALNGRSLQAELKAILEQAARLAMADARSLAASIRCSLEKGQYSDSAALLADDRQR
jgi:plasmid stability protein